jgi:ribosomal subunit interface protein
VDVVVQGRHCAVTDRFRRQVKDKIARLDRFASRVIRLEVEVSKEHTRMAARSERVELTVYWRGPLVRAEAAADDRFAALDLALDKLLARLRKATDRRRVHHGTRTPMSVARATAGPLAGTTASVRTLNGLHKPAETTEADTGSDEGAGGRPDVETVAGIEVMGDGPLVVREKVHAARPMTLDQALYEMELVGHDFYLFIDAESHQASVVYRRRGYDYGVIRLEGVDATAASKPVAAAASERRR